tara:strand:- start:4467 stop:4730 length:264 start_codon:yes stop_codon:yes gene_type:complete
MEEVNKVMTLKELMEEKSPYDDITYHVDKKFITVKRKGKDFYHIEKNRLSTEKERLEWVAHVSGKDWCYNHDFYKTMLKAIDVMGLK